MGELEPPEEEVCSLGEQDLYAFVRSNTGLKYSAAALRRLLRAGGSLYARVFYALSVSNRTVDVSFFKSTFLYTGFASFGEEDLLFVCEGVRLQLERGEADFYLVIHHFFGDIHRSEHLRLFLVFLVENGDYKIREFLVTHNVIQSVFEYEARSLDDRLFVCKFLKAAVAMGSDVIRQHVLGKGLRVEVAVEDDCTGFFGAWLVENGAGYGDAIVVSKNLWGKGGPAHGDRR